jgi:DNA-binding transcriptional regulator YbjK
VPAREQPAERSAGSAGERSALDALGNRAPRQPRGHDRRRLLVVTAAELLWSQGVGAVSHRRVADAAQVPLGSTTYYFSSLDTLVAAAVEHLEGERVAHAQRLLVTAGRRRHTPRQAAKLTVACHVGPHATDREIVCRYEMYVATARFAEVRRLLLRGRPVMLAQTQAAIATMAGDPPCTAERAAQVLDGTALESVIEGRDNIADVITAALTALYSGKS